MVGRNYVNIVVIDIKSDALVKEVIKYKNGRIWVWCKPAAYDERGVLCKRLRELFDRLPRGMLSGHDDSQALRNLRAGRGTQV